MNSMNERFEIRLTGILKTNKYTKNPPFIHPFYFF